jgi:hypothetical protein
MTTDPHKPDERLMWIYDNWVKEIRQTMHPRDSERADYFHVLNGKKEIDSWWLKSQVDNGHVTVQFVNPGRLLFVSPEVVKTIEAYREWIKQNEKELAEYRRLHAKFKGKVP